MPYKLLEELAAPGLQIIVGRSATETTPLANRCLTFAIAHQLYKHVVEITKPDDMDYDTLFAADTIYVCADTPDELVEPFFAMIWAQEMQKLNSRAIFCITEAAYNDKLRTLALPYGVRIYYRNRDATFTVLEENNFEQLEIE